MIYDDWTRTAADTFRTRRGNCMSFSTMFVAMARDVGLNVQYQEVEIPPDWTIDNDTYVLNQHVNVFVDLDLAGTRVVDFNIADFRASYPMRRIPDARALAHYYNNIGVERMLTGDTGSALACFRTAIADNDRGFSPAWVNLGTLYLRNGHVAHAEAAYLQAPKDDPSDLVAMRVSFLTENGAFLARVQGPVTGNVLLRREQYRRADDLKASAMIAQAILTGKIANCRTVLQRALRDHAGKIDADAVSQASQRLANYLKRLGTELVLDVLRGIEGESASTYFGVFDHLITSQKDNFRFHERNRRPPLDNVNCLLSFLYTIVMHDVRSALETVGLDPAVGFLHRDRPGRYGLALSYGGV